MRRHLCVSSLCRLIALSVSILLFAAIARAGGNSPENVNAEIPSPRSVLGFTPGDDRTIAGWREITSYFTQLDRASDRVHTELLGGTTLGRPFFVAYISAPENIRNLSKYKEIQRQLADPRTVRDDAARDRLLREAKTIVAISCSIHSNEIVASQMSMQLAYELATAADAETREILQNTILLLIPSANPDGIDIVAQWYRKTLGTPYEGKEPPELYHHYAGHDDNRDWFMLNLQETKLVTRLFWKEWFPQIVYDVHQQGPTGSRFFVPPFFDPPNPHIAPLLLRQVGLIGHKIAADLQAAGHKGVITNALYDTWWHGGFRTAPYYHNSIGILTEAASARLMTPINVTREQLSQSSSRGMRSALTPATNFPDPWPGGLWRPRDIMNLEMTASRAVLSMAAKYRADYVRNFYEMGRANSFAPVAQGEPLAYLIPAGQGRDEAVAKMVGALVEQGIEVFRLDSELHIPVNSRSISSVGIPPHPVQGDQPDPSTRTAKNTDPNFHEVPAGSYLILAAQPTRSNVRALLEPQNYPDRRGPGGEAERPYDVAGWTLPMQMGVETLALTAIKEEAAARKLSLVKDEAEVRKDLGLPPRIAMLSPIVNPVRRKVRLGLYKSWTASMDEGWTRYIFDTFNVPYRSLLDKEVREGNLRAKFDVIVLPSMRPREIVEGNQPGSYPAEYTGGIGDVGVRNLARFVEDGGTLICFDAATELAIKRFNLPLTNPLEGLRNNEFYAPGSILSIYLDPSQPLAQGVPWRMDAYFINSSAFEVMDAERVRVVARYAEESAVLRSGWLLGATRVAGLAALVEVPSGRGRYILFGFRPQHRGQTWGTLPLLFNAIAAPMS
jgi:hypothetical protein